MPVHRSWTMEHRTSLFEDAAAIVRSEYRHNLELETIAKRIATSRRQLQRAFSQCGGTTFREYVCAVRMEAAAEMLEDSSSTVGEIARRVGYAQQAQFAKAFRRHTDMSPLEYRAAKSMGRQLSAA